MRSHVSPDFSSPDPEVAPFPVHVLPRALRKLVEESAAALSCPPDYIAVPSLAVLGAAIGTSRSLEIKPGWEEFALLYTAVVGDPGSAKSPALRLATEPLQKLQEQYLEDYREARRAYANALREPRQRSAGPKQEKQQAGVSASQPGRRDGSAAPYMRQIVTTDATIESLAVALARNPCGVALVRDELTGWVRGMGEYKERRGADRQHWLSIWGLAPVTINRKNLPEPLVLPRPFVPVIGCLPPEMLGDLSDERGREDGFLHRVLFSYPDRAASHWTDAGVSSETRNRYRKLFDKLRNLPISLIPGNDHITLRFTEEGKGAFIAWVERHYAEMDEGPPHLRGPWSKMVAYCARLALIIHLTRCVSEEVNERNLDEESVSAAIALIEYFKSHTRQVYRALRAYPLEKHIATAVDWIRKRPSQEASVRDFITANVAGCKKNAAALHLFRVLEEAGWGRVEAQTPETGGRTTVIFKLDIKCR